MSSFASAPAPVPLRAVSKCRQSCSGQSRGPDCTAHPGCADSPNPDSLPPFEPPKPRVLRQFEAAPDSACCCRRTSRRSASGAMPTGFQASQSWPLPPEASGPDLWPSPPIAAAGHCSAAFVARPVAPEGPGFPPAGNQSFEVDAGSSIQQRQLTRTGTGPRLSASRSLIIASPSVQTRRGGSYKANAVYGRK